MLNIHYKNGLTDTITRDEYDDYTYDGKVVMIFKNGRMIALINIDSISGIYWKNENEGRVVLENETHSAVQRWQG